MIPATPLECLASALGAYFIAVSLGMLWKKEAYLEMMEEIGKSPTLVYYSSWISYGIGVLILWITKNSWDGWVALLTLFGWTALIKGFVRAVNPNVTRKAVRNLKTEKLMSWLGVALILIGGFLLFKGLGTF